jgi:K+-transporting ATPase KdpF subunit
LAWAGFWRSCWRHARWRGCEGGDGMFSLILSLAVAVGLFVYLIIALMRPDRF